jgi:HK97 family phage portal protein
MVERNRATTENNTLIVQRGTVDLSRERGFKRRLKAAGAALALTGSPGAALGNFIFPNGFNYAGGGMFGSAFGSVFGSWLSVAPHDFDYSKVDPYASSIVMGCLGWITRAFKEAKPGVYRLDKDGNASLDQNHLLGKLLRKPNPYYSYSKLIGATLLSYNVGGNAYWFKDKGEDGRGLTQGLYYVPHYMLQPIRLINSPNFIDYYLYTVNGGQYRVRPDQLVHFRLDLDPANPMMGRNPLAAAFPEIFTDERGARYTSAMLNNLAIPGVVITPDTEKVEVSDEDAEAIKENYKRKFGGDNVGEPLVTNFAAKVTPIGFSPEQMNLKDLRRLPEERVSACLGVHPSVAGLGAGFDRSTFSNYEQAVLYSVQGNLVPAWADFGDELTTQLLPEFDKSAGVNVDVRYNTKEVKALQEDADKVATRTIRLWTTNVIDRAEVRTANNFPIDEGRDRGVFFTDTKPQIPSPFAGGGTLPPTNGKRERAGLLLKAAPRKNLDQAYDLMLESEVREIIRRMGADMEALLEELGGSVEDLIAEAGEEFTAEDIGARAHEAIADGLGLIFLAMFDNVEPGVRSAVSLTLGLPEAEVWNRGTELRLSQTRGQSTRLYSEDLKSQTIAAIKAARASLESGASIDAVAKAARQYVEGRAVYPGVYEEAYNAAKARGLDEGKAQIEGESKARTYRANLIAETEARTYQNIAALESMLTSKKVTTVFVRDGDGCGWVNHEDPDKADKTTRPLVEARRYALAHPNCKRRFYPSEDQEEAPGA